MLRIYILRCYSTKPPFTLPDNDVNVPNFACCNGCEEKKITNLGKIYVVYTM